MSERDTGKDRPEHSIDKDKETPGDHDVDAPKERTDDEVGSDEDKSTQRTE